MQCNHAQELFSSYISDDLDMALKLSLENHLHSCIDCKDQVDGLRHIWTTLDEMPHVDPPAEFHANLMARLAAETERTDMEMVRSKGRLDLRRFMRPHILAYAAAALILLFAGAQKIAVTAGFDPFGSLLHIFHTDIPELETKQLEWQPDSAHQGGTLVIHLKAAATQSGSQNPLYYRLKLATNNATDITGAAQTKEGELNSQGETVIKWKLDSMPTNNHDTLSVILSTDSDFTTKNQKAMSIPLKLQ